MWYEVWETALLTQFRKQIENCHILWKQSRKMNKNNQGKVVKPFERDPEVDFSKTFFFLFQSWRTKFLRLACKIKTTVFSAVVRYYVLFRDRDKFIFLCTEQNTYLFILICNHLLTKQELPCMWLLQMHYSGHPLPNKSWPKWNAFEHMHYSQVSLSHLAALKIVSVVAKHEICQV